MHSFLSLWHILWIITLLVYSHLQLLYVLCLSQIVNLGIDLWELMIKINWLSLLIIHLFWNLHLPVPCFCNCLSLLKLSHACKLGCLLNSILNYYILVSLSLKLCFLMANFKYFCDYTNTTSSIEFLVINLDLKWQLCYLFKVFILAGYFQ